VSFISFGTIIERKVVPTLEMLGYIVTLVTEDIWFGHLQLALVLEVVLFQVIVRIELNATLPYGLVGARYSKLD